MKRLVTSVIILTLIILFIYLSSSVEFIQDDAFITFRYVENFLNGHGLVFNPGEYVEGYTSFLWVMILSGLALLSTDYISITQILSVFFGALLLPVTYLISGQFNIKQSSDWLKVLFNLLPVTMITLTGGFHYWSVSAMETSLFVLMVNLSILFYLIAPEGKAFIISLMLASLTRPEGLLFSVILIYHYLCNLSKPDNCNKRAVLIKNLLLIYIIPVGLYILFRFIYYGHLVPNTFFAKTGFGPFYIFRGIDYIYDSISRYLYFGLMLIAPLLLILNAELKNKVVLFYIIIGALLTGVIFIGGDVLPLHRFVLPVLPVIYILFSKSIESLVTRIKEINVRRFFSIALALLVLFISVLSYYKELPKINDLRSFEIGLVEKMKVYARWIKDREEYKNKSVSVCLSTIGAFSYYSNVEVIDMIGLTDDYIAHNPREVEGIAGIVDVAWKERRYNVDYIMERKPDYIVLPAGAKPSAYPESALFTRNKFIKGYYPQIFYSDEMDQYLPVFTKKSKIDQYENIPIDCSVTFINNYIQAQNAFLEYLRSGDKSIIKRIEVLCTSIIAECPAFESFALTVLGYAYYHSGNVEDAVARFTRAIELDEYNCPASIYMFNIHSEKNEFKKRVKYLELLKKHSPGALPNLVSEF